jgi:hypothetical protein
MWGWLGVVWPVGWRVCVGPNCSNASGLAHPPSPRLPAGLPCVRVCRVESMAAAFPIDLMNYMSVSD